MKSNRLTLFLVLLAKSSKLVKVWKVFKLLKFTKVFLTFFTMVISAFVYALWLGPWFAIGLILMLFIHEMGHIIAFRIKGYETPGPVFIPMLGAVIFAPKFDNPEDEAFIGYGGPLLGGIGALAVFGIWAVMPSPSEILLLVSYTAAFINLFNLIPIRPLDGGRVTHVIGEWFKYIGLTGLLVFTLFIRQPMMLLIWILVLDDINSIKPWLKFWIGVTCQLSMITLMFMGFSDQPLLADIIDSLLATMFNLSFYAKADKWIEEQKEKAVNVVMKIRLRWLGFYFALCVALVILMVFQIPHLPEAVKK